MLKILLIYILPLLSVVQAADHVGLLEATRSDRREYSPFYGKCLSQSNLIVGLRTQGFGAFDSDPAVAAQERKYLQPNMLKGLNLIETDNENIIHKYEQIFSRSFTVQELIDFLEDIVFQENLKGIESQVRHKEYLADISVLRNQFQGVPKNPIACWIQYLYISHLSGVVVPSTRRYDVIGDLINEPTLETANEILELIIQFRAHQLSIDLFSQRVKRTFDDYLSRCLATKKNGKSTISGLPYRKSSIKEYENSAVIVTNIITSALVAEQQIANPKLDDQQIYPENIVSLTFLSYLYDRVEKKERLFYLSSVIRDDFNPIKRAEASIDRRFWELSAQQVRGWISLNEEKANFLNQHFFTTSSQKNGQAVLSPLWEMMAEPGYDSLGQFYKHMKKLVTACDAQEFKVGLKNIFDGLLMKFHHNSRKSFRDILLTQGVSAKYRDLCSKIIDALWMPERSDLIWMFEHFLRAHLNNRDLYCIFNHVDNFDAYLPMVCPTLPSEDGYSPKQIHKSAKKSRRLAKKIRKAAEHGENYAEDLISQSAAAIIRSNNVVSDADLERLVFYVDTVVQHKMLVPVLAGYRGGVQVDGCEPFYNCGEIALYNLFRILYAYRSLNNIIEVFERHNQIKRQGEEDTFVPDVSKLKQIRDFFEKYPHISAMDRLDVHNEWCAILSNLNEGLEEGDNRRVVYVKDGKYEIHGGGLQNMLNVLGRLVPLPILQWVWDENGLIDQITYKLLSFCQFFSSQGFELSFHEISKFMNPLLWSNYGVIIFQINGTDAFEWLLDPHHFDIRSLHKMSGGRSSEKIPDAQIQAAEICKVALQIGGFIELDTAVDSYESSSRFYDFYRPTYSALNYLYSKWYDEPYENSDETKYYPLILKSVEIELSRCGLPVIFNMLKELCSALKSNFVQEYFFENLHPHLRDEVLSAIYQYLFSDYHDFFYGNRQEYDAVLANLIKRYGLNKRKLVQVGGENNVSRDPYTLWWNAETLVKITVFLSEPGKNSDKFRLLMLQKEEQRQRNISNPEENNITQDKKPKMRPLGLWMLSQMRLSKTLAGIKLPLTTAAIHEQGYYLGLIGVHRRKARNQKL